MAVNANVYSGREFATYIAEDLNYVGTFQTATDTTWKRIDIDSFSFPNFNPVQEFEMRSGTGRVAEHGAMFVTEKGVVREVSLTGRLTDDVLKILGENVLGEASSSGEIAVDYNHAPATLAHGTTAVSGGDYSKSLSMYFSSPVTGEGIRMSGLVCTSFQVSADMGTATGRFNFTATLQTGYKPVKSDLATTSMSTISSTKLFLSDLTSKSIIDGTTSGFADIDPLINSFSCTMAGNAQMLGMQGTDGDPEVIARQVPELAITFDMSIKYDDASATLIEEARATDMDLGVYLSNANETGGEFPAGSSGIGFDMNKVVLTSAELDSGDVANLNLSGKVTAPSSGEAFALLIS